jgi:hypothetical protein
MILGSGDIVDDPFIVAVVVPLVATAAADMMEKG